MLRFFTLKSDNGPHYSWPSRISSIRSSIPSFDHTRL